MTVALLSLQFLLRRPLQRDIQLQNTHQEVEEQEELLYFAFIVSHVKIYSASLTGANVISSVKILPIDPDSLNKLYVNHFTRLRKKKDSSYLP